MSFDPNNPSASGMVLTFDDEFNSLSASNDQAASGTTWTNHIWYNGSAGDAASVPGALSVHDGVLDITAQGTGSGWTSGTLESVNSAGQGFAQQYGYFEVRAKIPAGQGLIPTFYLMADPHIQNAGATSTEMDILETKASTPNDLYTTLHLDSGTGHDQQNGNNMTDVGVDTSQGYHTYGLYWDPNSPDLTFYFDGHAVETVPKYGTTDSSPEAMILQLITGTWGGPTDGSTPDPSHLLVDYVRVWQFGDQHPTAATPQAVSAPFGQAADNGSVLPGDPPPTTGSSGGTPDPATPSADGAVVTGTSGDIVTAAHNVFAIDAAGQITENGAVMPQTSGVSELAYVHGTLYQEATAQHLWWAYDETANAWTQTSNPVTTPTSPPTSVPSADGTIVTGASGEIVTAAHNVFTIDATGQITENGTVMPQTGAVTELAYIHGTLYQEATSQNLWWSFNEATDTWIQTSSPLQTAADSGSWHPAS